ncbi:gastrin-releasing peptide isoform X1 [Ictidomys tridecemlineatus]|uniref:gastrin-releasing peptide isoform X1 n=1 Tax=Ictidomys tridecemlineatus TaxID=43179 RepID=UPI000B53F0EA|nr:gastrin-releasing peptide isoform X1 [Ictidomys tridecemlineatus]KAG3293805.1 gastrin releasing peptide, transcript variant X1 [Ictidomys tridecemlineatus]
MGGPELPFVLLALVLCQAPLGPAAPVPVGEGTVLAKMYPRGNHWAVGHLMGKKSTGEFPYVSQGDGLKQQLRRHTLWEEAARNLLDLIQDKGDRSHQPPQLQPLGNRQPSWDSEERSNLKDVVGRLSAPASPEEGRDAQLRDNDDGLRGAQQNP